jgi:hypothetical protein
MTIHVMHDLETLDSRPSSAIISIGAVAFDPQKREIVDKFYQVLDRDDCLCHGLTMSKSTVEWWKKQSEQARAVFQDPSRLALMPSLMAYSQWWRDVHGEVVWANGTDFDTVILVHAYDKLQADPPWKFYNTRCYRTIKNMHPAQFPRTGTHHNAVDDAEYQTHHLFVIAEKYGLEIR